MGGSEMAPQTDRPTMSRAYRLLEHYRDRPAARVDRDARDRRRAGRRQERDHLTDLVSVDDAPDGVAGAPALRVRVRALRAREAGMHQVHRDAVRAELIGQRLRQVDDRGVAQTADVAGATA